MEIVVLMRTVCDFFVDREMHDVIACLESANQDITWMSKARNNCMCNRRTRISRTLQILVQKHNNNNNSPGLHGFQYFDNADNADYESVTT